MKKQYILFTEGDIISKRKAIRAAEDHGYTQWGGKLGIVPEGNGILKLDQYGTFYTSKITVEELEKAGFTKLEI